jgi:hypothetical protein
MGVAAVASVATEVSKPRRSAMEPTLTRQGTGTADTVSLRGDYAEVTVCASDISRATRMGVEPVFHHPEHGLRTVARLADRIVEHEEETVAPHVEPCTETGVSPTP